MRDGTRRPWAPLEARLPNIFDALPGPLPEELVTVLLAHGVVRIERIVSTGQSTPPDAPYDQDHDEWVLLLGGAAGLWIENEPEHVLRPGDYLLIPARRRHRVTWTATQPPAIWLVIHLGP